MKKILYLAVMFTLLSQASMAIEASVNRVKFSGIGAKYLSDKLVTEANDLSARLDALQDLIDDQQIVVNKLISCSSSLYFYDEETNKCRRFKLKEEDLAQIINRSYVPRDIGETYFAGNDIINTGLSRSTWPYCAVSGYGLDNDRYVAVYPKKKRWYVTLNRVDWADIGDYLWIRCLRIKSPVLIEY